MAEAKESTNGTKKGNGKPISLHPLTTGASIMTGVTKTPDLRTLFDFRDTSAVSSFLRSNPFIESVLIDAYGSIAERFGSDPPLALEVFSDPDEPGADQLFLLIQTGLPVDDALQRLDRLYEGWWLDILPGMQHKMAIALEPI